MGWSTANALLLVCFSGHFNVSDLQTYHHRALHHMDLLLVLSFCFRATSRWILTWQILTTMFFSWLSDKHKHRAGYILIQATLCLVGVAITAFAKDNATRYFGMSRYCWLLFLLTRYPGTFVLNVGNIGTFPGIIAYVSIWQTICKSLVYLSFTLGV